MANPQGVFFRDAFGCRRPTWWSQTGSNRRPPACKAGALPTELWPPEGYVRTRGPNFAGAAGLKWWAREDLNFRPHAYQACALTT